METQPTVVRAPERSRLRVLVVDDYPDAAELACEMVRMLGHDCDAALDGASAIAQACTLRPDLVVLDIGLPDVSGYDVARALRASAGRRPLVICALTGWGAPSDVARAEEAGIDHHLLKPASLVKVRELLAFAQDRLKRAT